MKILTAIKDRLTGRAALQRRGLLPFFDGIRQRWADPFLVWRALYNHPVVNLEKHGAAADEGSEPETTEYIKAIVEVFGVQRWDDVTRTGLTDWEILHLIPQLSSHLVALKKNTSPGPTSSPPTEPVSSSGQAPQSEVTS